MGRKDTVTKRYMRQDHIFADLFNYYIFGGQQMIRPEQLRELDTTEIVVPYGADGAAEPEQRYRDVMKSLSAMEDGNAAYLLLGIEDQSAVEYGIPVRDMLYDAMQYAEQVEGAAASHRRAKDYKGHSQGEFLSGFYKEDKLIPVITLVVLFSPDAWDGPTSLHEMLSVQDERILSLVSDHQIHLIAPCRLSDEELGKFHSSLKEVFAFIKYSKDKEGMRRLLHSGFPKLGRAEVDVLAHCVGVKVRQQEEEGGTDMCKAWEDMMQEVAERTTKEVEERAAKEAAQAVKETERRTILQNIRNVMDSFHVTADQAMAALKIPEVEQTEFIARL